MMSAKPNTTVTVGTAKFGNTLPLAVIAGPCALESRAHALEMAAALKEITGKIKPMTVANQVVGRNSGQVIDQNRSHGRAPSSREASSTVCGSACSAARYTSMK